MKYIILILSLSAAVFSHRGGNMFAGKSMGQERTKYLYVGAEACASKCHNNDTMGYQYDKWKISSHSRSFEALNTEKALVFAKNAGVGGRPWESMVCLKCHSTATGVDSSSLATTYRIRDGVTCEACHKGEFIPKTFLPKESDCLVCHNESVHAVSTFDFRESCLKISHPRPKSGEK